MILASLYGISGVGSVKADDWILCWIKLSFVAEFDIVLWDGIEDNDIV